MNELPIMPIRAKYADELSEGSPDRKKLDNLPVTLNVADVKSLTTAQCNALRCGDIVTKEDSTGKHAYVVTFKKDGTGMCLTYADGSGYIETVSYDLVSEEWVYNSTDVFEGSECSKVYVGAGTVDVMTIEDYNQLATGKYQFAIFDDDKFWTVGYIGAESLTLTQFDGDGRMLYFAYAVLDNDSVAVVLHNIDMGLIMNQNQSDAGKVLTINDSGEPNWQAPAAPGTKLYRHYIQFGSLLPGYGCYIHTNNPDPINTLQKLYNLVSLGTYYYGGFFKQGLNTPFVNRIDNVNKLIPQCSYKVGGTYPGGTIYISLYEDGSTLTVNGSDVVITNTATVTATIDSTNISSVTDNVAAL